MIIKQVYTKFVLLLILLPSLGLFGQTFQEFKAENNIDKKCVLAEELSDIYGVLDLDSSRLVGEHLLNFSNKKISKKGIYLSYYILGDYFSRTAKEEKALELLLQAKNYYINEQDYNKITKVYNLIGVTYQNMGELDKACTWYEQSLKYGESAPDQNVKYLALINLAQAKESQEEYELANKYAEQFKDWVLKMGSKTDLSNAFAVLGSIALSQSDFDNAINYFEQCFKFAEEANDFARKGHAYTNLGIAKFLQGKKEESQSYFLQALEFRKKVGNIPVICDAYLNYGGILFELGDYEGASEYYKEGIKIAQENKKYVNEIELLEGLIEVCNVQKNDVSTLKKSLETAIKNREATILKRSKEDNLLAEELKESERIQKSGFVDDNAKWPFYIGAVLLFLGFFYMIVRKKLLK